MRSRHLLLFAVGVALVAFGGASVNYTKPSAIEHHRAWSATNRAPAPSDAILFGGVASIAVGFGFFGMGIVTRRDR